MSPKLRPQIAFLCYGGLRGETMCCFVRDRNFDRKYEWGLTVHTGDAAVDRQRSTIASNFLKSGAFDVLLMVDHDTIWCLGDATYLVEKAAETKGVVGAVVSKRQLSQGFGMRLTDNTPHEIGSDKLVEIGPGGYMGAALLAIDRSVLAKMSEHLPYTLTEFWPFFQPHLLYNEDLGTHEYLSEDWAFCHMARELAGAKVYAAMKPVTRHAGEYAFTQICGNTAPSSLTSTHVPDRPKIEMSSSTYEPSAFEVAQQSSESTEVIL